MSYKGKIAAAALFCILGIASGAGITSQAAERPQYLKSVTYFGDEWPINYWNSEDKDMETNFARIAEDGFNSIILVIPWREFQPSSESVTYNEAAFERLNRVMDCAERHGLWVSLRIGYTWDYYGIAEHPARFANVTKKGSTDWNGWMAYAERLYRTVSAHDNYHSAFITWEDFWDYAHNLGRELSLSRRVRLAQTSGYAVYVRERYSLEEVNEIYGESFKSYGEMYLPLKTSPAARLFYDYYDYFLNEFLADTQAMFPELSMEVRADGDVVYLPDGRYTYYSHSATYPCAGAPYSALMYSVSMAQKNESDRISAQEALDAMERNLNGLYAGSGKPFFVEQLLYMDSTAAFSYNTQIIESQVDEFVRGLPPVLEDTTCGYGLWVYRNYVNNCVYNSQFALDTEGWTFSGGSCVKERNGTPMAALDDRGGLYQTLTGRLPESPVIYVELHAESDAQGAYVKVKLGDKEQTARLNGASVYRFTFPWTDICELEIRGGKRIYVDDVRVYTYEQYGRIYERDGSEGDLADAFRTLNAALP